MAHFVADDGSRTGDWALSVSLFLCFSAANATRYVPEERRRSVRSVKSGESPPRSIWWATRWSVDRKQAAASERRPSVVSCMARA
ncbi:hypothetical protein ECANGB1_2677 [Enterospora canceri]|uniref:Uncharacterized protein n=1 Tax=Enterospora canceri TaxID=1081671 RepID=A0A1Y1S3K3_9MICR|nr:hypothetical protein ECANGB1_2677 [Enterospora canceri]